MLPKFLRQLATRAHYVSAKRCADWSGQQVAALRPKSLLDVGCGAGDLLFNHLGYQPEKFCGIEAAPALKQKAAEKGIEVMAADLNSVWSYPDNSFNVVHSSQVIEHVHNTRLFVQESLRVLKPGGTAVITSENLTSLLNLAAMALGYTPFSLIRVCGWYLGNPLGLHYKEEVPEDVAITDPAFAGVTGHIRVLSALQAKELFERAGFVNVEVSSMGLMPFPDWFSRPLERWMWRRGHFLLIRAQKSG
jgi:SAM-dependent methyltransferase